MLSQCYCIDLRTAARKASAIYDEALEPYGINIAQYSLLSKIGRAGHLSLTELARLCELDRSTIGRNAKVLERMQLVQPAPVKDRREAVLQLTEAGKRRLIECRVAWAQAQARIEGLLGGTDGAAKLHELISLF